MAENVNLRYERLYQHNKIKNREANMRSPQNLKINLIF